MSVTKELYDLFQARTDVYAQCWLPKGEKRYAYRSEKKPYTEDILKKHLSDTRNKGIGIYPLLKEDECKWVAADFDIHNKEEQADVDAALERIYHIADGMEIPIYTERSKSGNGLHIWMFFSEIVKSWKARKLMMALITEAQAQSLSSMDRLFPSQDRLHQDTKGFGNLIHMPFSAHFCPENTVFFDRDGVTYTNDPDDIELWLGTVVPISASHINVCLEDWGLLSEVDPSSEYGQDTVAYTYAEDGLQQVLQDPFIVWCRDYPKDVDHDAWLAMISNLLPYGEDGIKAIHSLSSLDPARYNREAVDRKIIGCQGMKPITYQWITANTSFPGVDEHVGYKSPAAVGVKTSRSTQLPVFEEMGRYFIRINKKQVNELSNFTLVPKSTVSVDGATERIFDIHAKGRIIKDVAITSETLADPKKMKAQMLNTGRLSYYGDGGGLLRIMDYLEEAYPHVKELTGYSAVGLYPADKLGNWTVLTQDRAWTKEGISEDICYYNVGVKKSLAHSENVVFKDSDLTKIKQNLFMFNNMSITGTVIGWMAATMVAPRMRAMKGLRMPCLIVHGQAGCGKTQMAKVVMQKFFGDLAPSKHVGDVTRFIYALTNASSNMFPIFYDEYKPSQWAATQKKLVSEAIRGTYDGNITSRGRANLTSVDYAQIAPAVYIGEEGFTETALVERSVECFMSKEESFQYTDNFLDMKNLPMMAFGNAFLNWTLTITDDELLEIWTKEEVTNRNADRPIHNTSMVRFGLELMSRFFSSQGSKLIVDPVKQAVSQAQANYTDEYGSGTRSAVDFILESMLTMMDSHLLSSYDIKYNASGDMLFLNLRESFPKFRKWARETDYGNEMVSESEFGKQLRKMNYFEDYKAAAMGTTENGLVTKKVRVLSVEKMKAVGLIEDLSGDRIE